MKKFLTAATSDTFSLCDVAAFSIMGHRFAQGRFLYGVGSFIAMVVLSGCLTEWRNRL